MIICITGMPGAGKSLVGEMLAAKGFKEVEMSAAVKEKMAEKGIEVNKDSIRDFSLNSRKEYGNDVVARWTIEKIKRLPEKDILIVGLRSADEAKYFKTLESVTIISVVAPKMMRFDRLVERKRDDDPKNYSDFQNREEKEKQFGIASAMEHAKYTIRNSGSIEELKGKVEKILGEIKQSEKEEKKNGHGKEDT
ncbi:AAA family ATPase [Candidatus Marsarchaeota archaeon]|jgi:dephospho-CoA kinase|nr:AAA family ATPase [Candidatus Marsarchaeota archaeon]